MSIRNNGDVDVTFTTCFAEFLYVYYDDWSASLYVE